MKKKGAFKAFTIIELLVVLAVMGVFTAIAYPNIMSWITDREGKKEVYETVTFIKERKAEVANGNRIYPGRAGSKYRWVMAEGASASGNIASSCNGGNCKYNFSNGTYTVLNSGVTYKAGESIANRKAVP
jgi:prepilin-type N-terminal cleavage/methylation domain-containing protein